MIDCLGFMALSQSPATVLAREGWQCCQQAHRLPAIMSPETGLHWRSSCLRDESLNYGQRWAAGGYVGLLPA